MRGEQAQSDEGMHALRVLEFAAVLEGLAAQADTEPGRRACLDLEPSFDPDIVGLRIGALAEADAILGTETVSFAGILPVYDAVERCGKGLSVDGESLHAIGASLKAARLSVEPIAGAQSAPLLSALVDQIANLPRLEARLLAWLDGDGHVRDEASPALASARGAQRSLRGKIEARVRSYLGGKTREYLSDAVATMRNGRTVLPLKAENKGKIRGIVHDTSASGGTLFVEPEDLVALGNEVRAAEVQEQAEVERVLDGLSAEVGGEAGTILASLAAITELDTVFAKARFGHSLRGCVPRLTEAPTIKLEAARHPMLTGAVPLTIEFNRESSVYLVTGPNTGGKTVALKVIGLCVLMAQCGMMPPARFMEFKPVTQVWADVGDEQSLSQSLSTFSGHIANIAAALHGALPGSLVILDELGAGTDPAEGAGLARALLLEFHRKGAFVAASTHYGELKTLAAEAQGFRNCSMEFDKESLMPTYRLILDVPGASHAMAVAARLGIPKEVIAEAEGYMGASELDLSRTIQQLADARAAAETSATEAQALSARLSELEKEAAHRAKDAKESNQAMRQRASEEIAELLRQIRVEANEVFEAVKRAGSKEEAAAAKEKLQGLLQVGAEFVKETRPEPSSERIEGLKPGDPVRVRGQSSVGKVAEVGRSGKVTVLVGAIRMTVKDTELERVAAPPLPASSKPRKNLSLGKAMNSSPELHLRHMRSEDAQEKLEKFVDESVLAGFQTLKVVHGKGEGVLRKLTHDYLRSSVAVKSYALATAEEGGEGVTVVRLK